MNKVIHNFLRTGELGFLRLDIDYHEVMNLVPELEFEREVSASKIFSAEDITVTFFGEKLESIVLYPNGNRLIFPKSLKLGYKIKCESNEKVFKSFLREHNISSEEHISLIGEVIGIKLYSGVIVLFDNQKLYSMRISNFFEK